MNYKKVYFSLIEKRKTTPVLGYSESHHITPRSLGGSDAPDNIVELTAREHFFAHILLTKIHKRGPAKYKMVRAFIMMLCVAGQNQQRYISSKRYDQLRKQFSIAQSLSQSGERNSQFGTCWVVHDLFGPKRIEKSLFCEYVEQGWYLGRTFNYIQEKKTSVQIKERRKQKTLKKYPNLDEWYRIYDAKGFEEFVRITGYPHSKPNLVTLFAKYVPSFVPQNRKRRGWLAGQASILRH